MLYQTSPDSAQITPSPFYFNNKPHKNNDIINYVVVLVGDVAVNVVDVVVVVTIVFDSTHLHLTQNLSVTFSSIIKTHFPL